MRIQIPIYKRLYFSIFILVLVTFAVMSFTRGQTEYKSSTIMNATITFAISVTPSPALADGIMFGTLQTNTANNYALNDTTGPFEMNSTTNMNSTDYNLTVGSTTTFNVDFYNQAQYGYLNNSDNETILIRNVTLEANNTWNGENLNYSIAVEPNSVHLNVTWKQIGTEADDENSPCNNTVNDGSGYCAMVYYLDVPVNQPSGNYNTTYCYCAVEVGAGSGNCGCS